MKQFMQQNWSDSKILEKLKLQSDAELQPDSIMQFLGSKKPAANAVVTTGAVGILALEVSGIVLAPITAGLCVIAAGYIAYKTQWDYETRIEMLKQKMTKDFDNSMKYLIIHKYTTIYDKMVVDCEKHNKFVKQKNDKQVDVSKYNQMQQKHIK